MFSIGIPVKNSWAVIMKSSKMIRLISYYQIFQRVIKFIPINMVYFFLWKQCSTQRQFNKITMFKNSSFAYCNPFISLFVNLTSSFFPLHKREVIKLFMLFIVTMMFSTEKSTHYISSNTISNRTLHGGIIP